MPFAFNDDRSLRSLGNVGEIKVIESSVGVLVSAQSSVALDIHTASSLDIDSLDDYILLAKMFTNSTDQTKPISWKDVWDYIQDSDPPEGLRVQFTSNNQLTIWGYNGSIVDQYMWYRIVLMKIH